MKVLAVTGGGQGIGRGIAYHFARNGYAVSIADPDEAAGREACTGVKTFGGEAIYVRADVSREEDVKRWLAQTIARLGAPQIVVNNAGIARRKPFLKLSAEEFDRVLAVNLRGTFLVSQAAAKIMARRHIRGCIVNITSTRALMSEPNSEAYAASKGGIVALTHAMAMSLALYRIRVNCISPGWIETGDWQYSVRAKKPRHSKRDREQHPVGRVGTPTDVAEACLYLAERADFVTGQNLVVDGGMTKKMIYAE